MKDFFKSEDFCKDDWTAKFSDEMAKIANEKLNNFIESLPVVYGYIGKISSSWHSEKPGTYIQENYTHKARLAFIEEIVKEPCKHEPEINLGKDGIRVSWPVPLQPNIYQEVFVKIKCKHCGVELTAIWSEEK